MGQGGAGSGVARRAAVRAREGQQGGQRARALGTPAQTLTHAPPASTHINTHHITHLVLCHVECDAVAARMHRTRGRQQVWDAAVAVGGPRRHLLPRAGAAGRQAGQAHAHAGGGAAQARVQHVGGDGGPLRRRLCMQGGWR